MNSNKMFIRGLAIIGSCKSCPQLIVARNWISLAAKHVSRTQYFTMYRVFTEKWNEIRGVGLYIIK